MFFLKSNYALFQRHINATVIAIDICTRKRIKWIVCCLHAMLGSIKVDTFKGDDENVTVVEIIIFALSWYKLK